MTKNKINSLEKSFLIKIQALYDVENQLVSALPKLAKNSTDPELRQGFETHLEETKMHVERLEKIFEMLDEKPHKLKAEGIRGIIDDGAWVMNSDADDNIKDVMIASSARYAEHYEMAGYMSAILQADMLDMPGIVDLLEETLDEEEATDKILADGMKTISKKIASEVEDKEMALEESE